MHLTLQKKGMEKQFVPRPQKVANEKYISFPNTTVYASTACLFPMAKTSPSVMGKRKPVNLPPWAVGLRWITSGLWEHPSPLQMQRTDSQTHTLRETPAIKSWEGIKILSEANQKLACQRMWTLLRTLRRNEIDGVKEQDENCQSQSAFSKCEWNALASGDRLRCRTTTGP